MQDNNVSYYKNFFTDIEKINKFVKSTCKFMANIVYVFVKINYNQ